MHESNPSIHSCVIVLCICNSETQVQLVLTGIVGDMPAMRKLSASLGHSASLGCNACLIRGVANPVTGRGMYFRGYRVPVPAGYGYPVQEGLELYRMTPPWSVQPAGAELLGGTGSARVGDTPALIGHEQRIRADQWVEEKAAVAASQSGLAAASKARADAARLVGSHGYAPFVNPDYGLPYVRKVNYVLLLLHERAAAVGRLSDQLLATAAA